MSYNVSTSTEANYKGEVQSVNYWLRFIAGGRRLFIDPERNIYKYVVKQLQRELA